MSFRLLTKPAIAAITATALCLTGCAGVQQPTNPTQIASQWLSPTSTIEQKAIRSLLVIAITPDTARQRIFEDVVSQTLSFNGLPSSPGYQYLPASESFVLTNGALNVALLTSIAKQANASDILLVRNLGVRTLTTYNPGVTWGPGPGPWIGPMGPGPFWPDQWAIPPSVTTDHLSGTVIELLEASNCNLLWTASAETLLNQEPHTKTLQLYADLIYKKLLDNGFLLPSLLQPASAPK